MGKTTIANARTLRSTLEQILLRRVPSPRKVDSLNGIARLDVPFARAHALTAFAEHGADILQVLRARDEQLMQWSKRGELASLAGQAHLAAWFRSFSDQLAKNFL